MSALRSSYSLPKGIECLTFAGKLYDTFSGAERRRHAVSPQPFSFEVVISAVVAEFEIGAFAATRFRSTVSIVVEDCAWVLPKEIPHCLLLIVREKAVAIATVWWGS